MCASAGSRINTGFFVHLYIFLSQAAECLRCLFAVRARTGQVAPRSGELTLALDREAKARPRGLHPGQFAPRSGGETPRLIEPMPHVRAGSFVGTFPALPQARSRHAWSAAPRPCRRREGGLARAATDQLLSRSKRPLPRTRVDVPITARAALRPVPRLARGATPADVR